MADPTELPASWRALIEEVNGRASFGAVGVRDPQFPCEGYDGKGYAGHGRCDSDGHYMCLRCSHLSPTAPRFTDG